MKRLKQTSSSSQNLSSEQAVEVEDVIVFKDDTQRARYEVLAKRPLSVSYYFDTTTLATLGIDSDVMRLVNNINWDFFVGLSPRVYSRITFEFLSSFTFSMISDNDVDVARVKFRLFGQDYDIPLSQVNDMFGFVNDGHTFYPSTFIDNIVWRQFTNENEYSSRVSKSSQLIYHSHRYIHRFIAHTILGRGESTGVVNKSELFFLWCMENNESVNTGVWLCKHLHQVARKDKGKILVGGLITHIATCLGVFDEGLSPELPLLGNDRLNLERLTAMGVCKCVYGRYYLVDTRGNNIRVDNRRLQPFSSPHPEHPDPAQPTHSNVPTSPDPTTFTPHSSNEILFQILQRLDSIDANIHRLENKFDEFCQLHHHPPPSQD